MLGDSKLFLAGTIAASGAITPYSFATNNVTAGTKVIAPFSIEIAHQNANGLNSNTGIDLGSGGEVYLRWQFMNDQNGAAVSTAAVTNFQIDLFTTSVAPGSQVAIAGSPPASAATAYFLGSVYVNDPTNYPQNWKSGANGYIEIPPIPNYSGFQYLCAQFTSAGGNLTTGGLLLELVLSQDTAKGHSYKSGFAIV